jgi:hypothetical protein
MDLRSHRKIGRLGDATLPGRPTWIERWQGAGVVHYDWPPYHIRGIADENGVFEYVVTVDQSEIISAPWPALEDLKTTCHWDARFRYNRTKKRRLERKKARRTED